MFVFSLIFYFLHFFSLGYLVTFFIKECRFFHYYLSGLMLHQLFFHLFNDLSLQIPFTFILSLPGFFFLWKKIKISKFKLIVLLFIFIHLFFTVFYNALPLGDGHLNWMFHGKVIFVEKSLPLSFLTSKEYAFSHPYYPKFIGLLAAEIASLAGNWDDYTPHLSLIILLIPFLTYLLEVKTSKLSFIWFLFIFIFFFYEWIINGYMDYFLALYFILFLFSLNAETAILCLGMTTLLKAEAKLMLVASLPYLIWLWRRHIGSKKNLVFLLIFSFLNFFLWEGYLWHHGIKGAVESGFHLENLLQREIFISRFSLIGGEMMGWKGCLMSLFFLFYFYKRKENGWRLSSLSLYWMFLFAVYLISPYPLDWHLKTSVDRVLMPFGVFFFMIIFKELNNEYGSSIQEYEISPQ